MDRIYKRESCTWDEVETGIFELGADCGFDAVQQYDDCLG